MERENPFTQDSTPHFSGLKLKAGRKVSLSGVLGKKSYVTFVENDGSVSGWV